MVFSLAAVVYLLAACSAWGKVIYADDDAPTGGDGTSWTTAYRFLQDALTNPEASGEAVEVRVAQGTYRPDQGTGVLLGDTKATFRLLSGVTIKGGYGGLGQPDPNAWDPKLYETILYGDLQGNDDFQQKTTLYDNSDHVVTSEGVDETAVMEGLTITHGAYFGPMVRDGGEDLLLGGGGLYNKSGSPQIRQCVFSQNYVGLGYGSAVFNDTEGTVHYEKCDFENNYGTAIVNRRSYCSLHDCRFIRNLFRAITLEESISEVDGCLFLYNEGIAVTLDTESKMTISGCIFRANAGGISGGWVEGKECTFEWNRSMYVGGAVSAKQAGFVNCLFRGNSAEVAGAINAASVQMTRCVFVQNWAGSVGAIMCNQAAFSQCLFAGNQARHGVGAVDVQLGATVSNCTFVGNRAAAPGIIDALYAQEPVTVLNCIFRDNICADVCLPGIRGNSLMVVGYSNVSNLPDVWPNGIQAVANIDTDPLFADPGYWDPNGTPDDPNDDFFVEGDYHLKSQAGRWDPNSQSWVQDDVTSPCIDAGDPNSPIGDEPFPNGGRINMGAYGGTAEASKSYFGEPVCETIIAGDINGDGKVDWLDLDILSSHWLQDAGK
jgi:hypothetical protein